MKAIAILSLFMLSACAEAPKPDPWSPWYGIPKPTACGPGCEIWREPGLMVAKREGE